MLGPINLGGRLGRLANASAAAAATAAGSGAENATLGSANNTLSASAPGGGGSLSMAGSGSFDSGSGRKLQLSLAAVGAALAGKASKGGLSADKARALATAAAAASGGLTVSQAASHHARSGYDPRYSPRASGADGFAGLKEAVSQREAAAAAVAAASKVSGGGASKKPRFATAGLSLSSLSLMGGRAQRATGGAGRASQGLASVAEGDGIPPMEGGGLGAPASSGLLEAGGQRSRGSPFEGGGTSGSQLLSGGTGEGGFAPHSPEQGTAGGASAAGSVGFLTGGASNGGGSSRAIDAAAAAALLASPTLAAAAALLANDPSRGQGGEGGGGASRRDGGDGGIPSLSLGGDGADGGSTPRGSGHGGGAGDGEGVVVVADAAGHLLEYDFSKTLSPQDASELSTALAAAASSGGGSSSDAGGDGHGGRQQQRDRTDSGAEPGGGRGRGGQGGNPSGRGSGTPVNPRHAALGHREGPSSVHSSSHNSIFDVFRNLGHHRDSAGPSLNEASGGAHARERIASVQRHAPSSLGIRAPVASAAAAHRDIDSGSVTSEGRSAGSPRSSGRGTGAFTTPRGSPLASTHGEGSDNERGLGHDAV